MVSQEKLPQRRIDYFFLARPSLFAFDDVDGQVEHVFGDLLVLTTSAATSPGREVFLAICSSRPAS
jgi:hypothetical protein